MRLYLYVVKINAGVNSSGLDRGTSYVVAKDTGEAYKLVRKFLDENDIGFDKNRALISIELLADTYMYTDHKHMLFLKNTDHESHK